MTEPARYRCFRCDVSYRIAEPDVRAERLRCPECRLSFWANKHANTVRVGIYPTELAG